MELQYLAPSSGEAEQFDEDDDLENCIYLLRTLSNVFRWSPEAIWGVLATKAISPQDYPRLSGISKSYLSCFYGQRPDFRSGCGRRYPPSTVPFASMP